MGTKPNLNISIDGNNSNNLPHIEEESTSNHHHGTINNSFPQPSQSQSQLPRLKSKPSFSIPPSPLNNKIRTFSSSSRSLRDHIFQSKDLCDPFSDDDDVVSNYDEEELDHDTNWSTADDTPCPGLSDTPPHSDLPMNKDLLPVRKLSKSFAAVFPSSDEHQNLNQRNIPDTSSNSNSNHNELNNNKMKNVDVDEDNERDKPIQRQRSASNDHMYSHANLKSYRSIEMSPGVSELPSLGGQNTSPQHPHPHPHHDNIYSQASTSPTGKSPSLKMHYRDNLLKAVSFDHGSPNTFLVSSGSGEAGGECGGSDDGKMPSLLPSMAGKNSGVFVAAVGSDEKHNKRINGLSRANMSSEKTQAVAGAGESHYDRPSHRKLQCATLPANFDMLPINTSTESMNTNDASNEHSVGEASSSVQGGQTTMKHRRTRTHNYEPVFPLPSAHSTSNHLAGSSGFQRSENASLPITSRDRMEDLISTTQAAFISMQQFQDSHRSPKASDSARKHTRRKAAEPSPLIYPEGAPK